MKKIKLTQGKYAIVDDEDFIFLSRLNWYVYKNVGINGMLNWYARLSFCGQGRGSPKVGYLDMARFLVDTRGKNGYRVYHKNGDTLDNRKENLVLVPYHTMLHKARKRRLHKGKPTTSKYKGVYWNKADNVWVGAITKDKIVYWLGRSHSEKEMARRYNKKARELYGEFVYQNKIQ